MQALELTIPVGDKVPGDTFEVFGNADLAGCAGESIDYDRPITGEEPRPFWPLADRQSWGETKWGQGPWGDVPAGDGWGVDPWGAAPWGVGGPFCLVPTPLLYFGLFSFAVVPSDLAGNDAAGDPEEFQAFVNSGPRPVTAFRQTDVQDGQPVFGFRAPAQFGWESDDDAL